MPGANTFPHEIWLCIAQHIPPLKLQDLISLNSTFFEIGMDCRYRQMSFAYLDDRMVRNLSRLKDPAVAKRVRILHVYPGFIKETLDGRTDPHLRRSFSSRVLDLAHTLTMPRQFVVFPWSRRRRIIQMLQRTEDVVQIMLEVLSGLPNVTDYYVTWCGLPPITASAVSFLSTVFQSNLRKLSLSISLQNVRNLLTTSFRVQHLEELDLCIYTEGVPVKERATILTYCLAPAINSLRATLRTLTLRSWEPTDLAPLFYAIRRLPELEVLNVSIPIEPIHLGDPEAFSRLLVTHSTTLRTLHLKASCSGSFGGKFAPDIISFDAWVREAICSVHLPELIALDISSQHFPLPTAEACVRQFGRSLRSLALTGCRRGYANVEDLLDIILACQAGNRDPEGERALQRLRLNVEFLSPQLMTLFEAKLPRLQRLEVINKYLLPNSCSYSPTTLEDTLDRIDEFINAMQTHTFPFLKLRHMSIIAENLPSRADYEPLLEQTFRKCIPSLKSFT